MSEPTASPEPDPAPQPGDTQVPAGLVSAVVHLVGTGAVALGAYTIAELTAVDAVVDFLAARPSDEVLAEAVRSLAARQLLLAGDGPGRIEVRGDLGLAVTFQRRARLVLDARVAGTESGEPWRMLVLPQPERICLMVRIDALGVHELSLHTLEETLGMVSDWLPRGSWADADGHTDPDAVLAAAERSALLTAVHYKAVGSAETAESSTDLVLARRNGRLHAFIRDPQDATRLVPSPRARGRGLREIVAALLDQTVAK
ncbi:hypothetical protein [Streptacidiphilus sp. MAP5-3]|uniref:hypothetical protein n=1 Tax=unclassified Streptacidiphilus TaxID=2643834 RepID=UPI003512696E